MIRRWLGRHGNSGGWPGNDRYDSSVLVTLGQEAIWRLDVLADVDAYRARVLREVSVLDYASETVACMPRARCVRGHLASHPRIMRRLVSPALCPDSGSGWRPFVAKSGGSHAMRREVPVGDGLLLWDCHLTEGNGGEATRGARL